MEMQQEKKYTVIVIDGIIGAGKTTLLNNCLLPLLTGWGLKVTLVPEPVDKWKKNGRLEQFYVNTKRRAYQFQTVAFHDRVKTAQKLFRKCSSHTDVFILERSIFTDKLFASCLHDSGMMDETEYEDYLNLWNMWEEVMPFKPDLFVYLKPDVNVAMDRLKNRNRSEESKVSVDYQKTLQEKHDEFLGGEFVIIDEGHFVPCMHLYTNSNFRDDDKVKEEVAKQIMDKIKIIREH